MFQNSPSPSTPNPCPPTYPNFIGIPNPLFELGILVSMMTASFSHPWGYSSYLYASLSLIYIESNGDGNSEAPVPSLL